MKILWFSNYYFNNREDDKSGTWLGAMGRALVASNECQLCNITVGFVSAVTQENCPPILQFVLPAAWGRMNLPKNDEIEQILRIIDGFSPDLIHIWGFENYFGLLASRGYLKDYKVLFDVQGIQKGIAPFYMGGLSLMEQLKTIRLKEVLKPTCSLFAQKMAFERFGRHELEIVKSGVYLSFQSDWSLGWLRSMKPGICGYKTKRMLRSGFYEAVKWCPTKRSEQPRRVMAVCGINTSYKCAHVLIRAFAEVLKMFNGNVELRIAGSCGETGIKRGGYCKFIDSEIDRLGIGRKITFLGPINTSRLIEELQLASVFVHPSLIESYSLAVAEAMYLGVPSVISYAGAMTELAEDGKSAMYYPSMDHVTCARRVVELLLDDDLCIRIGQAAINVGSCRNDFETVVNRQLEIYDEVLKVRK